MHDMSAAHKFALALLLGGGAAVTEAATFQVEGVHLGMTQEELQAQLGSKIHCSARTPSQTDPAQASCVNPAFTQNKKLSDTFAGQKTVIRYHILDGRVARISFLGFPSMAFDAIVQTMEATYGKANVASKTVRIAIKSELVDKRATWGADGGDVIVFDKYTPGNLNRAYLNFYANSYPKPKPKNMEP
jgi:hypothetical protein